MYRFSELLRTLQLNSTVEILEPISSCPKSANIDCSVDYASCSQGIKKQCVQSFKFFAKGCLKIIKVTFFSNTNDRHGLVRENDISIRWLLDKGFINNNNLVQIN